MIYLRQPITGLLTLTSQPISGRDTVCLVLHPGLTEFCSTFSFNLYFYFFTVLQFRAGQAMNIPPSAILGRYGQV